MVTSVTDAPEGAYTPTDRAGNQVASYTDVHGDGDLAVFIPTAQGSTEAALGTITFSFPEFPALVIREFEICNATTVGWTAYTIESGNAPLEVQTDLKEPVMDESGKMCKNYTVNVHDVTAFEITTDGYINNLAVCVEVDMDNSNNAPPFAVPTVSPSPTMCPESEPILVNSEGGTMFDEGDAPIIITEQTGDTVTFQVVNTWNESFTSFYVEYHSGGFGETECLQTENVDQFTQVAEYTAQCLVNVPISIVSIWIVDCEGAVFDPVVDTAEVPLCCEPAGDSTCTAVQYTFKLECVDPCPPEDEPVARRLSRKEQEEKDAASAEAFKHVATTDKTAAVGEPSADGKDGHFCVSEDYPCGDDGDRVFVCHYSARDGYKTFCVPEPDSDVLAFYPKDYCGPCVGGYGGSIN
jgi:hypothetical protein